MKLPTCLNIFTHQKEFKSKDNSVLANVMTTSSFFHYLPRDQGSWCLPFGLGWTYSHESTSWPDYHLPNIINSAYFFQGVEGDYWAN